MWNESGGWATYKEVITQGQEINRRSQTKNTLVTFAAGGEEPLAQLHILFHQFEISGLYFVCIIFGYYNF